MSICAKCKCLNTTVGQKLKFTYLHAKDFILWNGTRTFFKNLPPFLR